MTDPEKTRSSREPHDRPVTTEAMNAVPLPVDPDDREAEQKVRLTEDPTIHPAAAAREIPVTSGGLLTDPDLAELPDRAAPSISASRFEIELDREPTSGPDVDSRGAEQSDHDVP